jgi:hypothetical protein
VRWQATTIDPAVHGFPRYAEMLGDIFDRHPWLRWYRAWLADFHWATDCLKPSLPARVEESRKEAGFLLPGAGSSSSTCRSASPLAALLENVEHRRHSLTLAGAGLLALGLAALLFGTGGGTASAIAPAVS